MDRPGKERATKTCCDSPPAVCAARIPGQSSSDNVGVGRGRGPRLEETLHIPCGNPVGPPLPTSCMRNRLLYSGVGVLAVLVGVAAGHLVAALTEPASSPVLAVG